MNAQLSYEQEAALAEQGGIIDGVKAEIDKAIAEKITPRFNQIDGELKDIKDLLKQMSSASPAPKP